MPELPEIEVVIRTLNDFIIGDVIQDVQTSSQNMRIAPPLNFKSNLLNHTITKIRRRAKYIIIELQNDYALIVHLGMSGKLYLSSNSSYQNKHNHLIIKMAKEGFLIFHDPRRFGFYTTMMVADIDVCNMFASIGIEPLSATFDTQHLMAISTKTTMAIKKLLMDCTKIAGIGNIYASEILYMSRIRPDRASNQLTKEEIDILTYNIKLVLQKAISHGGSTLKDYRDGKGNKGNFQNHLLVYGKESKPCPKCLYPIQNIKISGRSTYYCNSCQY